MIGSTHGSLARPSLGEGGACCRGRCVSRNPNLGSTRDSRVVFGGPAENIFCRAGCYVSHPGSARCARVGARIRAFANFRFLFITLQLITSRLCWACFN